MKTIYQDLSEERKNLQEKGLVPEWFSTSSWQLFSSKYITKTEKDFKSVAERISKCASKWTDDPESWEKKFFNVIWNGWLSCATPVLANMGTDRGCPVSCSGNFVSDSVYDFYETQKEVAVLSKNGFGTSSYLGSIRPRGSDIKSGGKASGVLPVLKDFVQLSRDISQGNTRRGAWAGYIEIDHDDFWEIINFLNTSPDDCNIGWIVSDSFIKRLNSGDKKAISRYQKAMKTKMVTGKGYFFFADKTNKLNPKTYKDHGLRVKASNLCVAPETLILTDNGYQIISDLEDQFVNVWNGQEFSNVQVKKTGTNQELIKVITSDGFELECTPYHKFYVKNSYNLPPVETRAINLKSGDKLIKLKTPTIDGNLVLNLAYQNGFFSGDGCEIITNGVYLGKRIYLYHEKRNLKHLFEKHSTSWIIQEDQNREYFYINSLEQKFFVPDSEYTISSRLEWLAGFLDADGVVLTNGNSQSIQAASIHYGFLQKIQLMLQTLGVQSKIKMMHEEGYRSLPKNDGSNENSLYKCQTCYRLLIAGMGIVQLQNLGLVTHRLKLTNHIPNRNSEGYVSVSEIIQTGRKDDTFCFTEPKRNMGVFNGILTGNCSEITLVSDKEHTYTCVLSSLNLAKYDEWKDTDTIFVSTVFLDCVASEFIAIGKEIKGLENAVRFTEKSRALGLGVMGFHTYLQSHMIPFESMDAHFKNIEIFKKIKDEAEKATKWMAETFGEPEWCRGYGRRNTHLIAVAPTLSTAGIMGGVSQGIEPVYKNVYVQGSAAGEMNRINPIFLQLLKDKGIYNEDLINEVIDHNGSVQNVDWLTDEEKKVFKTAFEIDQKVIVRLASVRQQFIDQAQSINLFFSADESEEYISEVHQIAFNDPMIKSLYYIRSESGVQASKGECESCAG